MRLRLVSEFLKHGTVGAIRLGATTRDVIAIFGRPSYTCSQGTQKTLIYGEVNFFAVQKEEGSGIYLVEAVYIETVRAGDRHGLVRFKGGPTLRLVSEGLCEGMTLRSVKALLRRAGLRVVKREVKEQFILPEEEHEYFFLQTESGALISLERFSIRNPGRTFKVDKIMISNRVPLFLKPL